MNSNDHGYDSISITENTGVQSRVDELGDGELPETFAVVPEKGVIDGRTEYYHKIDSQTLRKLFNQNGIDEDQIEDGSLSTLHNRDISFLGPVLFFSAHFIANNWGDIVSLISIIQTYAKDKAASKATLDVEYESPDGEIMSVSFEGDPDDLPEVLDVIKTDGQKTENSEEDMETTRESD